MMGVISSAVISNLIYIGRTLGMEILSEEGRPRSELAAQKPNGTEGKLFPFLFLRSFAEMVIFWLSVRVLSPLLFDMYCRLFDSSL